MPSYLETRFFIWEIHASTKFMATVLNNGTIIILTVTVVFNEIPCILIHGVKVKE